MRTGAKLEEARVRFEFGLKLCLHRIVQMLSWFPLAQRETRVRVMRTAYSDVTPLPVGEEILMYVAHTLAVIAKSHEEEASLYAEETESTSVRFCSINRFARCKTRIKWFSWCMRCTGWRTNRCRATSSSRSSAGASSARAASAPRT